MTIKQQKEQIEKEFQGEDCPWNASVEWVEDYNHFVVELVNKKNKGLNLSINLRFNEMDQMEVDTCNDDCWHSASLYLSEYIGNLVISEWENLNEKYEKLQSRAEKWQSKFLDEISGLKQNKNSRSSAIDV